MKKGEKKKKRKEESDNDKEVEQLLQSAQDELLLNLSVDSHMSRVSPDYLLPDLNRRFQALKSRPTQSSSTMIPKSQPSLQPHHADADADADPDPDEDHLFARFAALKASSSSSSSTTTTTGPTRFDQFDSDANEDDEVEKIIRWAKDAARLDPSPPSDDD